jgi:hypothetical protein
MKRYLKFLIPVLVLCILIPAVAHANSSKDIYTSETYPPIILAKGSRSFGGSSRSFRSSPSRSWGSKSSGGKSKSWGSSRNKSKNTNTYKSKTKSKNNSTWGKKKDNKSGSWSGSRKANANKHNNKNKITNKKTNKKSPKTKRKLSKADKKLAEKAKKSGKYHKTRKAARDDFKKKNASKYTSKYATKPTTRPSHIPQTTSVGGVNYNVTYNSGFGGYGYYGPGGAWMMYDMMRDVAMMDMMMSRNGYFIAESHGTVVPMRGFGYWFTSWIIAVIIIIILVLVFKP